MGLTKKATIQKLCNNENKNLEETVFVNWCVKFSILLFRNVLGQKIKSFVTVEKHYVQRFQQEGNEGREHRNISFSHTVSDCIMTQSLCKYCHHAQVEL